MIVKRKVFSILTDESGEERLYSVNETLLEDYKEKVFGEVKRANKAAKKAAILKKDSSTVSKEEIDAMRGRIEGSKFMQQMSEKKGPVFSEGEIRDMVRVKNARRAARGVDDSLDIALANGGKLNFDTLSGNDKRSPESKKHKLEIRRLENFLKELEEGEKRRAERRAVRDAEMAAEKAERDAKMAAEKAAREAEKAAREAAKLRKKRVAEVEKLRSKKAFAKNAKIGGGIAAGTALVGTGAYLAKKHYDKKKDKKD